MAVKAVSRLITGAADYEEGVWTPVLEDQTTPGVQSYNGRAGRYVKLGPMVHAWFQINLNALGTGSNQPEGAAQIAGLPFAARDKTPTDYLTYPAVFADISYVGIDGASGYFSLHGRVFNSASVIRLRSFGDGLAAGNPDIGGFGPTSLLIGCAQYLID